MPEFPIIDAHVHLWDPARYEIPWLRQVPALNDRFELERYAEQTRGIEIEAFVYEEIDIAPDYRLLEVRQADAYAAADPRLRGIVAAAPLEYGDQVGAYLAALVAESPRVKGVRRLLQGEADPEFCLRPGFVRGVELLAELDLSFDICVYHPQLAGAVELVRRVPEVRFILNHIGKPGIRDGLIEPWRTHVSELASLPNVACKISGATTEADLAAWTIDDVAPYVLHVLDAFGEDRVMFASDWPVVTQAATYRRWEETVDTLTSDWSEPAKRKLWVENARNAYRLG
ncbi:MAG: amidohydrolase family protein [Chloroflexota bacterium]|nr:amidohydrolase family protein [Chloroflexota bacterium]